MAMANKIQKPKNSLLIDTWSSSRIAVFGQVTFITISVMATLAGGGYLLDQWLGTFPTLFIIGLVVSFPLAQAVLWRQVKGFAQSKVKETKK